MINVLHVIAGLDPRSGGVVQAVKTMSVALRDNGVHSEIVSLDDPVAPYLSDVKVPVHALGQGHTPWCYNGKLYPWLIGHLLEFAFVIVHGLWLYNGYAVRKARQHLLKTKKGGRAVPRLLVMPHGMLDPYFQNARGRKLKAIRNRIFWRAIERDNVNTADALLFTCEEERRLSHVTFNTYHPREERVVGLGVARPPAFSESMRNKFLGACPWGLGSYLLFMGRLDKKKGLDLLLDAYEAVALKMTETNSYSDNSVHRAMQVTPVGPPALVLAGPGVRADYGQNLSRRVASSPVLSDKVFLPGMLSGDEKWGALYGAEALILPSHQENVGIAVVEALACGTPVLISDKVNIWQEVEKTQSGFVAPDTFSGVVRLLEDWMALRPEARTSKKRNATDLYETSFAVDPAAKRLISSLLGSLWVISDLLLYY